MTYVVGLGSFSITGGSLLTDISVLLSDAILKHYGELTDEQIKAIGKGCYNQAIARVDKEIKAMKSQGWDASAERKTLLENAITEYHRCFGAKVQADYPDMVKAHGGIATRLAKS